jgi:hypothetical protein
MVRTANLAGLGLIVLLLAALAPFVPVSAQAGATIAAVPAQQPDTYTVTGTGFAPGVKLKVIEVTCGELPCAAGGGGFVNVTPDSAGAFSVTLTLNAATAPTDRDFRLIAAFPDDRAGLATDPQVKVAVHHAGSAGATPTATSGTAAPQPPATGTAGVPAGEDDGLPLMGLALGAVAVAIAAAGAVGVSAAVKRR